MVRETGRMFLLQLAIGFTVGWGVARLGQWLPQKLHGLRHPLMAWSITLPIWIALAAAMFSLAPGAAYLWVLPLLAAGVLLAFLPLHSIAVVRLASAAVLAVAAALWLQPATSLLYFIVATLGRLPIVSPSFVYAAVLTAAALMIVPPLLAAVTPIRPLLQPAIGTAAGLFAIAVTAGLAYMAPAYTNEEPLRRVARAFQDGDGAALWEVGSVEPGIDLGDGAPPGWRPAKDSPPTRGPHSRPGVPVRLPRHRAYARAAAYFHRRADARARAGRLGTDRDRHPANAGACDLFCPAGRSGAGAIESAGHRPRRRALDRNVPRAASRGRGLPRQLRRQRLEPHTRSSGHGHCLGARRWFGLVVAAMAAAGAHGVDGQRVVGRRALRPPDCTCSAATLEYVTVTPFDVTTGLLAGSSRFGSSGLAGTRSYEVPTTELPNYRTTELRARTVTNPFVYGEIVPTAAFVDREVELDRLGRDLYAGQKVFLISPRRYGKSSLVRQALKSAARSGALTVEVQVSSYSSYVAFLEGYARALASAETRLERARSWLSEMLSGVRPEVRIEPDEAGRSQISVAFPAVRTDRDISHLAQQVFALPGRIAESRRRRMAIALDEFQGIAAFNGGSVEHALRAAVQQQRQVGYVFSGSEPALMERMLGKSRPFYKAGPVMRLQKIPADRFASFIESRFKATGYKPVPGLGMAIVELSGNLPYDVQRLAHEVWDDVG